MAKLVLTMDGPEKVKLVSAGVTGDGRLRLEGEWKPGVTDEEKQYLIEGARRAGVTVDDEK